MAGTGSPPKQQRARRNAPARGEWQPTEGYGWQHGPMPPAPKGLLASARSAWKVWMEAWFASHWSPEDLPMLYRVVKLYDKADRGEASAAEQSELRQLSDSYGITPKGQQDRRWKAPEKPEAPAKPGPKGDAGQYGHLSSVP